MRSISEGDIFNSLQKAVRLLRPKELRDLAQYFCLPFLHTVVIKVLARFEPISAHLSIEVFGSQQLGNDHL